MSNYQELINQANALMREAEALKSQERAQALTTIKGLMRDFDIDPSELSGNGKRASKSKNPVEAKYKGPNGELWSGRGRRPSWVVTACDQGATLESFLI
jgi:DNA-binding protein H-NS